LEILPNGCAEVPPEEDFKAAGQLTGVAKPSSQYGRKRGGPGSMKISIVVPAFNEAKLIAATLRGIQRAAAAAFAPMGWEVETIVCDNNSTDATAQLAQSGGARVVFEPINQIARARNTGAAAAVGDWLLFIDADSRPTPELLAEVAQQIQSGCCLAGGSTVVMDHRHWLGDGATGLWNMISRLRKWMAGSFIFCETAAFRKIGGFNLELFASEELDLSIRLKKVARQTGKTIVILHRHPLLTSGRKVRLYSPAEWGRFALKAVLSPRRTVTSREACGPWYDGRR
jgi:glycosyltransferase involved in cell wall biosynthesis